MPESLSQNSRSRFENEQIVGPKAVELLRRTRPIYLLPHGRPESELRAVGSGFFLRYLNRTLLITASHVILELQHGDLHVPTLGGTIESIVGTWVHTGGRNRSEALDRIDLAFLPLSTDLAARLPPDNYFTVADWDIDDRVHEKSHYLFCGWPAKRNQPNPRRPGPLPRAPISYLDTCHPPAALTRYDITQRTHYAVRFDPKRALDDQQQLVRPPHLSGVSGSPCCFFHRYSSHDDLLSVRSPKLVGVVIEVQKDAVIATRLSILLQLVQAHLTQPAGGPSPESIHVTI